MNKSVYDKITERLYKRGYRKATEVKHENCRMEVWHSDKEQSSYQVNVYEATNECYHGKLKWSHED